MNVVDISLEISCLNAVIDTTFTELISISHDITVDVIFQNCFDESDILIICDSTAVIDLSSQEVDDLVRNVIVFIQQHFQLFLTDGQILIGEFISNIPTYSTELSTILNDSVEQGKSKEEFLVFIWFFTVL